jgi:hypothetical protein
MAVVGNHPFCCFARIPAALSLPDAVSSTLQLIDILSPFFPSGIESGFRQD